MQNGNENYPLYTVIIVIDPLSKDLKTLVHLHQLAFGSFLDGFVVPAGFLPRAECVARTAFDRSFVTTDPISDRIVFDLQNYKELSD